MTDVNDSLARAIQLYIIDFYEKLEYTDLEFPPRNLSNYIADRLRVYGQVND